MTQISFLELFAGWSPELCVFAGLFGFMLFAMAAITLITAPVTPRRPLHNRKLVGLIGREPHTPLDEAIRRTLVGFGSLSALETHHRSPLLNCGRGRGPAKRGG
jgi:hypothetical protein